MGAARILAGLGVGHPRISGRIAGTPITAAMVFTAVGLLVGSEALGLVEVAPAERRSSCSPKRRLRWSCSRTPRGSTCARYAASSRCRALLGIGLPLTLVAGFVVALVVFPELFWAEALLLAVILAPTDAALGQAVVTLMRLPSRVRQGLNVESGLNDGICVPLFWIVLAIAQAESGAIGDGAAVRLVLEQIGYGILAGVLAGIAAACVVVVAGGHRHVGGSWLQVVPLAGAGLAFGIADPIGGSGFIAAFVGGFVFGALRRRSGGEVGHLIEELGEVFNAVTFIVFGAVLLGPVLGDVTWSVALYAVLSLTVVRLLPVAISMIGTGARRPTVAFLGWFGPRGLASIVFAVLVLEEGGLPHDDLILVTIYLTIGLSVLAHGLTAAPLANRYAAWFESHPRDALAGLESSEVQDVRWRFGVGHSRAQDAAAAAERRAALALEAGAARRRRRSPDRCHVRLLPADDRGLPRRLARREGHVVGVDRRARGSYRGQHSDLRAAVAGAPPRPAFLDGADDDPGDHCAFDRRAGRRGGRDRDRLRDAAALGLRAGCRRSIGDAGEPLEPARQPGVSDPGALPVDDGRGGDGGAGDRGVRRRGDPGHRGGCARARPLQQPHGRGDRRPGGAGSYRGQGSLPPSSRSSGVEAASSASESTSSTSSSGAGTCSRSPRSRAA